MARPTKRLGSSKHQFRKRVPADVLKVARGQRITFSLPKAHTGDERILVPATIGTEVQFSLRTDDPSLVRLRHSAATEQFERACAAFREGPRRLSNKDRHGLAGVLYRDLAAALEDEPVSAEWWQIVQDVTEHALDAPTLTAGTPPIEGRKPLTIPGLKEDRSELLERYVGPFLDPILTREGVVAAAGENRLQLLEAFAKALIDAAKKLKKNAEGDYSHDTAAQRFPTWDGIGSKIVATAASLTFDELLTRWEMEGTKAASSKVSFKANVAALEAHLGHNDARRVARADVIAWKDALIERGLSPKTINDSYLASIRTLFNVARRNDLLEANPVEGVRVPQKRRAGEGMLPYDDEEVAAILALADAETASYLHWIPWLLALTGARVGEIAQLWGQHVEEAEGIHVLHITPTSDGGTLKTASSERKIPIHAALIDRGFLEFVATRNGGPLFYGGKDAKPSTRKSKTSGHASDGPINRVREWIRGNGFNDPRKAPNHAFRHWFKTKCSDLDIADSIADAIQGHSDQSAAANYRKISVAKMAEAIDKIPVSAAKRTKGG